MASLTELIESYINDLLSEEEEKDYVSLRRKELAEFFGCVPSQINYVLRSRFTPERGYLIESQRGGHGYIKILKIVLLNNKLIGKKCTIFILKKVHKRGYING